MDYLNTTAKSNLQPYFETVFSPDYKPSFKMEDLERINFLSACSGQGKTTFVFWLLKYLATLNSTMLNDIWKGKREKDKLKKLIYIVDGNRKNNQVIYIYLEEIFRSKIARKKLAENFSSYDKYGIIPFILKEEEVPQVISHFNLKLTQLYEDLYVFQNFDSFNCETYCFFDELDFSVINQDQLYMGISKTTYKERENLEKGYTNNRYIVDKVLNELSYPKLVLSAQQYCKSLFIAGTNLLSNESIDFMCNNNIRKFSITLLDNKYISKSKKDLYKQVENGCLPLFGTIIESKETFENVVRAIVNRKNKPDDVLIYTFLHFEHIVSDIAIQLIKSSMSNIPGEQSPCNGFFFFPAVLLSDHILTSGTFNLEIKSNNEYILQLPNLEIYNSRSKFELQSKFNSFFIQSSHMLNNFLLLESYVTKKKEIINFKDLIGTKGRVTVQPRCGAISERIARGMCVLCSVANDNNTVGQFVQNNFEAFRLQCFLNEYLRDLLDIPFPYLLPSDITHKDSTRNIMDKLENFIDYLKIKWKITKNIGFFVSSSSYYGGLTSPFDAHCFFINKKNLITYNFEFRDQKARTKAEIRKILNQRKRRRDNDEEYEKALNLVEQEEVEENELEGLMVESIKTLLREEIINKKREEKETIQKIIKKVMKFDENINTEEINKVEKLADVIKVLMKNQNNDCDVSDDEKETLKKVFKEMKKEIDNVNFFMYFSSKTSNVNVSLWKKQLIIRVEFGKTQT